jgi:hypothetical protein
MTAGKHRLPQERMTDHAHAWLTIVSLRVTVGTAQMREARKSGAFQAC